MARKVTPRWGETGVMKVPAFTLDEEGLAEIGSALGVSAWEVFSQLKPRLEEIAQDPENSRKFTPRPRPKTIAVSVV